MNLIYFFVYGGACGYFLNRFEATRQIRSIEKKIVATEQSLGGYEEKVAEGIWHVPIFAMTADVIQATWNGWICIKTLRGRAVI